MKNLFMIISTPFWTVNIDWVPQFDLQPLIGLSALEKECSEFKKTTADETDARAFDFSRRPNHAIVFAVAESPVARRGVSIAADLKNSQILELSPGKGSFSSQGAKLGLASAGAVFKSGEEGVFLHVHGKDLACDLISQNAKVKGTAPLRIGPSAEDIFSLNEMLSRLEKGVTEARNQKNPMLGAALLGYRSPAGDLAFIFEKFLITGTFELSQHWEIFGGKASIKYEKAKEAGPLEVEFSVPAKIEAAVRSTETDIAKFAHLSFDAMSEEQRRMLARLNKKKAQLLRALIEQKLAGRNNAE